MSNCKDTMGNPLEIGHWVTVIPPEGVIWVAKIVEVNEGGLSLSLNPTQKGVTPAKIRLVLDITLNANPVLPVFPNLCRIVTPPSKESSGDVTEITPHSAKPS